MGAAVRRLARLRPRPRLTVLGALVVLGAVALIGGWLWLRDSSLARVEQVAVSGATGSEAPEIRDALEHSARQMTTLHVDTGSLRRAVAEYPQVKDVRADASPLHRLRIQVIERPPVAALVVGGQRTAIAADGTLLRGHVSAAGLPALNVRTLPAGSRLDGGPTAQELALLAAAPDAMRRHVERVERDPEGLVAILRGGPRILLGDGDRPHAKWVAAARVLSDSASAGAGYIDVRLPGRPAAGGFATTGTPTTTTADASTSAVG